MFADDSAKK